MTLDDLGPRICILGPSNSGKSTLAKAIGHARGHEPIHLDQLCHLPNTDWQVRPQAEFTGLHDAAILGACWVIDGNYSNCLPQRLARATGVIKLDAPTAVSLWRYFRRCWFERTRVGGLEGGTKHVKWLMIRYIAVVQRGNRKRNQERFDQIALPKIALSSPRELARFYRLEGLGRQ